MPELANTDVDQSKNDPEALTAGASWVNVGWQMPTELFKEKH